MKKSEYSIEVDRFYVLKVDIWEWVQEHGGRLEVSTRRNRTKIVFLKEEDAVAFKLRFDVY